MDYYPVQVEGRPVTVECAVGAAVRWNVPANVLLAILEWENLPGKAKANKNGTFDLGQGGINTVHLSELRKLGIPDQTSAYFLMHDGCYNAEFSAYLLRRCLTEPRVNDPDFWTRVACYHSKTPSLNAKYQSHIRPLAAKWASYLGHSYTVREYHP